MRAESAWFSGLFVPREVGRVLPGVRHVQFLFCALLEFDPGGGGEIHSAIRSVDALLDPRESWTVEMDMAEIEPDIVGKLVDDAVVVHGGAGAVEVPEGLPRQVVGVTVSL